MSQLEVDKIIPQSGTTLTIGDSGDTVNFADGTALSIDTNTLYIDSTNNRVGIGTSSPATTLHVSGGTANTVSLIESTDTYAWLSMKDNSSANSYINSIGASGDNLQIISKDITFRTTSAPNVSTGTYGTERMRINSSGNVGIGDTAPDGSLHITRSSSSLQFVLERTTSNTGKFGIGINNGLVFNDLVTSTERMRIDSSGNFMVGTTDSTPASSSSGSGISLRENGSIEASRDGSAPLFLNRSSSDGKIIDLYKDGTTVGSIGIESAGFYIDGEALHTGLIFTSSSVSPRDNGSETNNATDLGNSLGKWKDLYLGGNAVIGGGVYLGGTGTANKLDDYEEGTFTPAITSASGSVTHSTQTGNYTKVGRLVYFDIRVVLSGISSPSGALKIEGLPFTGGVSGRTGVTNYSIVNNAGSLNQTNIMGSYISNSSSINISSNDGTNTNASQLTATTQFDVSGMYQAT